MKHYFYDHLFVHFLFVSFWFSWEIELRLQKNIFFFFKFHFLLLESL